MTLLRFLVVWLYCCASVQSATLRELFSNSAVYLSYVAGPNLMTSGSGFIIVRPNDPSTTNQAKVAGQAFLITNKHVLPPEGKGSQKLEMRVNINSNGVPSTKTIDIPIAGADGRYLRTVKLHPKNDVAAVLVSREIQQSGMPLEFIFTNLLGTKEILKQGGAALVGDDVFLLGYPAGIYDLRNAYPIWRTGIIATSPLLGYAFPELLQQRFRLPSYVDGFLIDAQVYPGSSGSIVINRPTSASIDNPGVVMVGGARSTPYVLGIVSDSIPILDTNLHLVSRMGLGIVQSADAVQNTIDAFFK
jgi:hypothetical protein